MTQADRRQPARCAAGVLSNWALAFGGNLVGAAIFVDGFHRAG